MTPALTPVFAVLEGGQVRNAMHAATAAEMMAKAMAEAIGAQGAPPDAIEKIKDEAVAVTLRELHRLSALQPGAAGVAE